MRPAGAHPRGPDSPEPETPQARTRAAAAFILFTVFLDAISIGIMLPLLPKLIASFMPGDAVLAAQFVGFFGAAWGLSQLFGSPLLGALSDRYGRRPVILVSNLGLGLDYMLMAFAPTLWLLLVGRIIAGLCGATFATAYAYVSDVTPEPERAAAYGRIGAVFGLGFILGPAIGGLLAEFGPRVPFILAAVLSLLNFAYGWFVLPESLSRDNRMAFSWARANPFASLRLLRRSTRLGWLAVINLLDQLALVSIPAAFVLYTAHKFQWTELTTGLTFAAIGVGLAIVQGLVMGPVVARLGNGRTLKLGMVFGMTGFMLYGLAPSSLVIWAAIPLLVLWGLVEGPMQAYMSGEVGANEYGQLQGAIAALHSIAETIGPLMFAGLFAFAIGPALSWMPAGAPFLLAALLHMIGLTIAVVLLSSND